MVLQRAPAGAVLWGYAEIGASINISYAGAVYNDVAKPGKNTMWSVQGWWIGGWVCGWVRVGWMFEGTQHSM